MTCFNANKTPLLLDTATTVIREEKIRVYFYQSRPVLHVFLNLEICTKINGFLLNWLLNECCKTSQAWISCGHTTGFCPRET